MQNLTLYLFLVDYMRGCRWEDDALDVDVLELSWGMEESLDAGGAGITINDSNTIVFEAWLVLGSMMD